MRHVSITNTTHTHTLSADDVGRFFRFVRHVRSHHGKIMAILQHRSFFLFWCIIEVSKKDIKNSATCIQVSRRLYPIHV